MVEQATQILPALQAVVTLPQQHGNTDSYS